MRRGRQRTQDSLQEGLLVVCRATTAESKVIDMFVPNLRAQLWEYERATLQRERKMSGESHASFCWDCFVLNLVK